MRLTLDIPDTLAERLRAEAEARGEDLNNYAVAKLEMPLEDIGATSEAGAPEDPEVIAIGLKAMAAWDSGDRGRPAEEVFAEMEAKYGSPVTP